MPSFVPAWWLPGGHAQTCWPALFPGPSPRLHHTWWRTPDGDALRMAWQPGRRDAPWVLMLHGLEGSAQSHYIRTALRALRRRGWNGAVMEYRGCSGRENRAPRLYHSGETSDVDFVARRLAARVGAGRLWVVGFSLGGNVLGKWLGEAGDTAPIAGAAMVSAPFDLAASGACIDNALGGFYARRFLATLIPKAVAKARQHPGRFAIGGLEQCRSIVEYDDRVTAPLHGFASAADYYRRSACAPYLANIRRPLLVLSAEDDPLVPGSTIPRSVLAANSYIQPRITPHGGHLGWIDAGAGRWWVEALLRGIGVSA